MRHVARGLLPAVWGEDQFLRVLAIAEKTCHRRPIMRVIAQSLTHASLHCPPSSHRTLHMPIIIIPPPFLRPVDPQACTQSFCPAPAYPARALIPSLPTLFSLELATGEHWRVHSASVAPLVDNLKPPAERISPQKGLNYGLFHTPKSENASVRSLPSTRQSGSWWPDVRREVCDELYRTSLSGRRLLPTF